MSPRAPFSVLTAPPAGGAELTGAEQRLVEDFRQMSASSRTTMARFFDVQARRDREQRIAASKPKFQVLKGGAV
jgi:hypothetical protein